MKQMKMPTWGSWIKIPLQSKRDKRRRLLENADVVSLLFDLYMGVIADPTINFKDLLKRLKV